MILEPLSTVHLIYFVAFICEKKFKILMVYNILRCFIFEYDGCLGVLEHISLCKFLVAQVSILCFKKIRYLKSKAI